MKRRQILRFVAKYATLTICGILLYLLASMYAFAQRGYFAVGGEAFLLLFPILYYIAETMIRDIIRSIKGRKKH